jgi:hypothetical protein
MSRLSSAPNFPAPAAPEASSDDEFQDEKIDLPPPPPPIIEEEEEEDELSEA